MGPIPPQPAPCATAAWEGVWLPGHGSQGSAAESLVERRREDRPAQWRCGLSFRSAAYMLPVLFVVLFRQPHYVDPGSPELTDSRVLGLN